MDQNLRSEKYYVKNIWDYTPFNDCFPESIKLGDIDGSVIWNGEHLITEFKHPSFTPSIGQSRMFGRLLARGNTTIFIVEGEANNPQRIKIGTTLGITASEINEQDMYWTEWVACDGIDDLTRLYKIWTSKVLSQPSHLYNVPPNLQPFPYGKK